MTRCPLCDYPLESESTPEGTFVQCTNCPYCKRIKPMSKITVTDQKGNSYTIPTDAEPIVKPGDKAKSDPTNNGIEQIPLSGLIAIGSIFEEGRLKYGKDNWKNGVNDKGYQTSRLVHAITHLMLYANGDRSENHLAKVAWFCVTQLELERLESCTPNITPS